MKKTTLPIAELIEDSDFYPRHAVDAAHVASLVRALEAGENLPPVTADQKSKRLVDGWHRVRAYRRLHGAEAVIDVELKNYESDMDMLLDAIALNAGHGRRLDRIDQVRAMVLAQKSGATEGQIALALKVTVERVKKLEIRVAGAPKSGAGAISGTRQIALKRPAQHLAGKRLTEAQAKAHLSAPGTSYLLVARQLSDAIRSKLINLEDEKLMEMLKQLHTDLSKLQEMAASQSP